MKILRIILISLLATQAEGGSLFGGGTSGGGSPGGTGSEVQYRAGASTFGAVTNSSVSGGAITLTDTLTLKRDTSQLAIQTAAGANRITTTDLGDALGGGAITLRSGNNNVVTLSAGTDLNGTNLQLNGPPSASIPANTFLFVADATNNNGGQLTIMSGAVLGGGIGNAGTLQLTGGVNGGTGNGGQVSLAGGGATNGDGGKVSISSGIGIGSGKIGGDLSLFANHSVAGAANGNLNIAVSTGSAPTLGTIRFGSGALVGVPDTTWWSMSQIAANRGHFVPGATNTYDIGTSSATARTGYFGTSVVVGGNTLLGNIAGKVNATQLALANQAIGDLLIADSTSTFARLADVATGSALISGGIGAAPTYGKIGLTTHVDGTLAVGNGGTGVTDFAFAGSTHTVATTTGVLTNGNCVKIDISGNFVDHGSPCGGGGSPGGTGSELQYRAGPSTFGAVTGSSVAADAVTLAGTLTLNVAGEDGLVVTNETSGANFKSRFYSDSTVGPFFGYYKGRGTKASPLALNNLDVVFQLAGFGHDSASLPTVPSVRLRGLASENFDATHHGADFVIETTTLATADTPAERARFNQNGLTLSTPLTVPNGGIGVATLTGIAKGNGTSAFTAATAGTDYVSPSSTETLTNKTLDAEATGNTITIPFIQSFPMAGCNNATAGTVWDLPTANAAVPTCYTGTNIQKGGLAFSNGQSAQYSWFLPSGLTGTATLTLIWKSAQTSATGTWALTGVCTVVDGTATDDPAFTTFWAPAQDTSPSGANQLTATSGSGVSWPASCAGARYLHLKLAWTAGTATTFDAFELTIRYRRQM